MRSICGRANSTVVLN